MKYLNFGLSDPFFNFLLRLNLGDSKALDLKIPDSFSSKNEKYKKSSQKNNKNLTPMLANLDIGYVGGWSP